MIGLIIMNVSKLISIAPLAVHGGFRLVALRVQIGFDLLRCFKLEIPLILIVHLNHSKPHSAKLEDVSYFNLITLSGFKELVYNF